MRLESTNVQRLDDFSAKYVAEVSRRGELVHGIAEAADRAYVSLSNPKLHHAVASGEITLRVSDLAAILGVQAETPNP